MALFKIYFLSLICPTKHTLRLLFKHSVVWLGSASALARTVAPRRDGQPQDEAPALVVFEGGAIKHNEQEYNQCRLLRDKLYLKYELNFNF